ncbi:LLM class flavin-dependent oxidoreductase [Pseudonocardia hispaniensis]|uniref:LLM class flavin-dependent oxidoreductase n=1 Tax=Pseudonocardia hispaniensis TaxID=904933 RepID=A0ABW1IYM1_9PSEU
MVKVGIFLPNGSNGYIMSAGSPQYLPTFEHNKQIAVEAERSGFDMILSMMKYRGFGGSTGYWDHCLESFTLMAGLASVTTTLELFPTVTIPALHPAVVARYVSTIDDISDGRCGLNIVTGWNRDEYDQMGLWPGDDYYTERYEFAGEYVGLLRSLWEHGRVTANTEHFTLDDCTVYPQPKHRVTIVSAGQSPAAARFVSEFADRNFVQAGPDKLAEIVGKVKAAGSEKGRDVGTYAVFHLIADADSAKAYAMQDEIVRRADSEAIGNMIASAMLDANPDGISRHQATGMSRPPEDGNSAFMTIPTVTGSYTEVAERLDRIIEDTGIDGVLFSFPDFVAGVRDFGDRIRPLMKNL